MKEEETASSRWIYCIWSMKFYSQRQIRVHWFNKARNMVYFFFYYWQLGGYSQTVDTRVLKEIHSLVESGVRSTSEIRGHINRFVPTLMDEPPTKSRRFVPKDQDIRNAVYRSLQKSRWNELQYPLIFHDIEVLFRFSTY